MPAFLQYASAPPVALGTGRARAILVCRTDVAASAPRCAGAGRCQDLPCFAEAAGRRQAPCWRHGGLHGRQAGQAHAGHRRLARYAVLHAVLCRQLVYLVSRGIQGAGDTL
jgi:hypothetical protein